MTIEKVLQKLKEVYPDKIVTRELSSYEQGKLHGAIDVVRYIERLLEEKDN